MKRILSLLLAAALCLSAGCGSSGGAQSSGKAGGSAVSEPDAGQSGASQSDTSGGQVQVDEGLLTTTITLPATFFEDQTEEDIKTAAAEEGYLSAAVNGDGSVTYTMTKAQQREMLAEYKANLEESFNGCLEGDGAVASFVDINYNDNFSQINVSVDPEKYTEWDALYMIVFFMGGAYYQIFDGVSEDQVDITINFINSDTQEVMESFDYQKWIAEMESAGE